MNCRYSLFVFLIVAATATGGIAQDTTSELQAATAELATTKYQLIYKFNEGEEIRYKVEHKATIDTKISGTRQVDKSTSTSTKLWIVESVDENNIRFSHLVSDVEMWQKTDGRDEVRFNSRTDSEPPVVFQHVAESIGKPLAVVTIDRSGRVIKRDGGSSKSDLGFGGLVVPLPKREVELGHARAVPKKLKLREPDGRIKEVKTQMRYRLEKVQSGVATISVKTQVLTPVNNAALKSQLVQQLSSGELKFDIDAGRVISKQLDWAENVIGFSGAGSNMKYLARFTEQLLDNRTAQKKAKADEKSL
jgi:hypothetical protein